MDSTDADVGRRDDCSATVIPLASGGVLDLDRHEVRLDGRELALTKLEWLFLRRLVKHLDSVVSNVDLHEAVYGHEPLHPGEAGRLFSKMKHRLIDRLGDALVTCRGFGYRLAPAQEFAALADY